MRHRTVTISGRPARRSPSPAGRSAGSPPPPAPAHRRPLGQAVPHPTSPRGPSSTRSPRRSSLPESYFAGLPRGHARQAGPPGGGPGRGRPRRCTGPSGTYFVTADIRPLGETDGIAFCRALPERAGVVAIPHGRLLPPPRQEDAPSVRCRRRRGHRGGRPGGGGSPSQAAHSLIDQGLSGGFLNRLVSRRSHGHGGGGSHEAANGRGCSRSYRKPAAADVGRHRKVISGRLRWSDPAGGAVPRAPIVPPCSRASLPAVRQGARRRYGRAALRPADPLAVRRARPARLLSSGATAPACCPRRGGRSGRRRADDQHGLHGSGPGWSSVLTGVWPDRHGVTGNDFTGADYLRYPDFLTRATTLRPGLRDRGGGVLG
ncbi:hypothetical protein SALBM311S_08742 [Streptomyces alboniger]